MIIKPSELESQIKKETAESINILSTKVNKTLRESAKNITNLDNISVSIGVDEFSRFTIEQVIIQCKNAGWNAIYQSNQHDGSIIVITKKIPNYKWNANEYYDP